MIILQILKITGIVLLCILALILILIAVILFVPIHYKARADYSDKDNDYNIHAKAHWILHIIRFNYDMDKNSKDMTGKVLFFKIYPKEENRSGTLGQRKGPAKAIAKIKYKISKLYVKIKRIICMINDERDQKAAKELLLRVKRLLWHIRPRKLDMNLRLGMDDPCSTGEITGYIYSLYPLYTKHLHYVPDFDNKVIEADAFLKGYIQLVFVLYAAAKVYFDKDIRRLYEQIQKVKE